jgi:hypothetical protein
LAHVGEYSSHTFSDEGLGDGAADATPGAGDQRYLARGVERIVQDTHVGQIKWLMKLALF